MSKLLYPHLTVQIDVEPFFDDLVKRYKHADSRQRTAIHNKIRERGDNMAKWLIQHGYQCGRDYQRSNEGYRFASGALATAFVLGVQP